MKSAEAFRPREIEWDRIAERSLQLGRVGPLYAIPRVGDGGWFRRLELRFLRRRIDIEIVRVGSQPNRQLQHGLFRRGWEFESNAIDTIQLVFAQQIIGANLPVGGRVVLPELRVEFNGCHKRCLQVSHRLSCRRFVAGWIRSGRSWRATRL